MKTGPNLKDVVVDTVDSVMFSDLFDLDEIQHLQDLFSDATGVASIITHPDGTPITKPSNFCQLCNDIIRKTKKGRANCYKSDAALGQHRSSGPVVVPCLSGELWDAGASMTVGGKHIANWLIGQVRNEESDEQRMIQYADEIGANKEDFMEALAKVPVMSVKQFNKVSDMLFAYAKELSEKAYVNLQLKIQIGEREKATEAVYENEEKYRLIAENTSDGILLFDGSDRLLYASPAADILMGAELGETMKMDVQTIFNLVHPDERENIFHQIYQAIRNHENELIYAYRVLHKTGKYIWREDHAKFTYDQDGKHLKTIVVAHDITERKLAQEELIETKEKYRGLSEAAFEAIFISEKGLCIEQNHSAETMFGYTSEEAIGRYGTEWIVPEDRAMVMDHMLTGYEDPYEATALKKDGTTFPCMLRGKMMHYKGRKVRVTSLSDISDRKQVEKNILELNEKLDQRVRQRTAELEAAIKELETFSYSVSHDLRAPLRHINGFMEVFLETKSTDLTEEELGFLEKVTSAATEMERLIEAILSFSRLNMTQLRKTRIRTTGMVQQVIRFFGPELHDRKIDFNIASLPDIKGDEELIRQVWTNLISNAIKYTGKKAEALIEIGSMPTDNGTTFFVKDNGAGFNMKYAEKLFGVFQRLHKSRDFEGVGIGLANVNRIIKRHGGKCRAEGEPDKGATFYFSLPD